MDPEVPEDRISFSSDIPPRPREWSDRAKIQVLVLLFAIELGAVGARIVRVHYMDRVSELISLLP